MDTHNRTTPTPNGKRISIVPSTTMDSGTLDEVDTYAPRRVRHHVGTAIASTLRAYIAALFITGVMLPFAASVMTIILYFSPTLQFLPALPIEWYAPIYGIAIAAIIWLGFAIFCGYFGTARGANPGSYELLQTRWCQLKARLGLEDDEYNDVVWLPLKTLEKNFDLHDDAPQCKKAALREAYACCKRIYRKLHGYRTGLSWILGSSYIATWGMMHRAEEALIEVEPLETVLRGAMHDMLCIQGSSLSNSDALIDKLVQAVKDLDPLSTSYFSEHQPDKSRDRLLNELIKEVHSEKRVLREIAESLGMRVRHADNSTDTDDADRAHTSKQPDPKVEANARYALREIRRTLNAYRDSIWDGMVRARNQMLGTIALTGIVTHILLSIAILTDSSQSLNRTFVVAATAFYIVGAVAGLFGRFYNELSDGTAKGSDDYGLTLSRLIATPLLSGLAGIGGVLVTALIYDTLTKGGAGSQTALTGIFSLQQTHYFLIAAVFGLAPNLLISSLQQQTKGYMNALKKSKGTNGKT